MPSSQDIANDAAATFAAYPELVTKIDDGTTVPDGQLDRWIGATYANFVDGCLEQINEVFVGSRAISGPLRVAGAPASGWNANADDVVIGDGTANRGLTLYQSSAATAGGVYWRTPSNSADAIVSYNVADECLILAAGRNTGGDHADLALEQLGTSGALRPRTVAQSTDLGSTTKRWRDLFLSRHAYVDPATAPATPSSGAVLYVDSADGALKVKFSTGTVVTLGTP